MRSTPALALLATARTRGFHLVTSGDRCPPDRDKLPRAAQRDLLRDRTTFEWQM
jgi:hypothetical protein